jgi:hypothetical protein
MTDTGLQSMPNNVPEREHGILAYASVPVGVFAGWAIPQALLKNTGPILRNSVASIGAIGLGYLAASTFLKPASPPYPLISEPNFAFPGFSKDVQPTPQMQSSFMHYATGLASRAPAYDANNPNSPLNNIVRNLAEKGLTEPASALRKHLMIHGQSRCVLSYT